MPAVAAIPMLIGAGVSAAGSVAAAKIGSNAAKSAAQTQANAANQAMGYQSQMFNQIAPWVQQQAQASQQNFAPYQQMGGAALQALYSRLGLNPGMGQGAAPQMPQMLGPGSPGFGAGVPQNDPANFGGPRGGLAFALPGGMQPLTGQPPQMPQMQQGLRSPIRALQTPYMPLPGPQRPQGGG